MSKYVIAILVVLLIGFYIKNNYQNNKRAEINSQKGAQFLQENRRDNGVVETETGLQYKVLTRGENSTHPTATDKVTVHYHGTTIDGTVFDSSVERNQSIEFGLNQVIKGWTEGVQLMTIGDKYRFFIPADLAYGRRAIGTIPPGSVLIFEVELLKIN